MVRTGLAALVVLSLLGSCTHAGTATSTRVSPYLVYLENGHMAVVLDEELPSPPTVEWWPGASSPRVIGASRRRSLWVAELPALPPGTRFSYRVRTGSTPSDIYSSRTSAPRGGTFRFAVYGGTAPDREVHRQIVDAILRERIDFVVHTGAFVEAPQSAATWRGFMHREQALLAKVPLLPAVDQGEARRRFLLTGQAGYARDWGDLRLLFLDATDAYHEGSPQYRFLRDQLSSAVKEGMYTAIVVHAPPFSSGRKGSDLGLRAVVSKLAARYGVELVLSGQAPHYERSHALEGTTYVVSGAAGARIYRVDPQSFSARCRPEPHYVLVEVTPSGLVLQVINLESVTIDAYLVRPNPPRAPR